ncbi:hypothetical protein HDF15_000901 [Granulicella mallensis]|uniref:Uncharacterized protein n=1 Tax=Granulicella mallensis TaxID=940614 RepID=A0A7W7ZMB3_9BACT|nr:hypothetical protein [Granulicella mallensis]
MSCKPLLRQSLKSGLSASMDGCMLQSNGPVLTGIAYHRGAGDGLAFGPPFAGCATGRRPGSFQNTPGA